MGWRQGFLFATIVSTLIMNGTDQMTRGTSGIGLTERVSERLEVYRSGQWSRRDSTSAMKPQA